MSEAEYIAILWKVIAAMGTLIVLLGGGFLYHVLIDRGTRDELNKARIDLQRCKDRLGINGSDR